MFLLYFLIGYIALYLAIWLHEVGHAVIFAKYNCKDNPFDVYVPLYLFFSTPNPVHQEKVEKLNLKQIYHVGIAGIITNLVFGLPIFILLLWLGFPNNLGFFFLFSFALFHLVEAATYLIISNIFLSSDMVLVQQYNPKLRVPFFLAGLLIVGVILYMIINCPESWRTGLISAVIIMTISMGLGRIIFTKLNTVKSA